MKELTFSVFVEQLHTTFLVIDPDFPLAELTLVEATEKGSNEQYERFVLLFEGSADTHLPQRTYEFKHPQLGELALFIVPISNKEGKMQYEVIFNSVLTISS